VKNPTRSRYKNNVAQSPIKSMLKDELKKNMKKEESMKY